MKWNCSHMVCLILRDFVLTFLRFKEIRFPAHNMWTASVVFLVIQYLPGMQPPIIWFSVIEQSLWANSFSPFAMVLLVKPVQLVLFRQVLSMITIPLLQPAVEQVSLVLVKLVNPVPKEKVRVIFSRKYNVEAQ